MFRVIVLLEGEPLPWSSLLQTPVPPSSLSLLREAPPSSTLSDSGDGLYSDVAPSSTCLLSPHDSWRTAKIEEIEIEVLMVLL